MTDVPEFFLVYDGELRFTTDLPQFDKIFLWFPSGEKTIKVYYPEGTGQVTKLNINRLVGSITRAGHRHPSGPLVGQGFEVVEVSRSELEDHPKHERDFLIAPSQWGQVVESEREKLDSGKLIAELEMSTLGVGAKVFLHLIEINDSDSGQFLLSVPFPDVFVEKAEFVEPNFIVIHDTKHQEHRYAFDLFKPLTKAPVETGALTLHGITYNKELNKGYYYGSFEVGEYTANQESGEITVNKTFACTHVTAAAVDHEQFLLGYQAGNLRSLDWKTEGVIWEVQHAVAKILTVYYEGDKVYSGQDDGTLIVYEKATGVKNSSHHVAEVGVSAIAVSDNFFITGDEDGNVRGVNRQPEVESWRRDPNIFNEWKVRLDGAVTSILVHAGQLLVATSRGEVAFMNPNNGGIVQKANIGHRITSNVLFLDDWWLVGSGKDLLYGRDLMGPLRSAPVGLEVNSLASSNEGLIIASNSGHMTMWKKIGVRKV